MREYLEPMLGTTGAMIAQFAITLIAVAVLILIVFWLIRIFTAGRLGAGHARGRQPRLSVLDALPIDQRRRLVLIRRDNVEHLLLIGGPSDLVVEGTIHRAPPPQRRAEAAARAAAQPSAQGQRYAPPPVEPARAEPVDEFEEEETAPPVVEPPVRRPEPRPEARREPRPEPRMEPAVEERPAPYAPQPPREPAEYEPAIAARAPAIPPRAPQVAPAIAPTLQAPPVPPVPEAPPPRAPRPISSFLSPSRATRQEPPALSTDDGYRGRRSEPVRVSDMPDEAEIEPAPPVIEPSPRAVEPASRVERPVEPVRAAPMVRASAMPPAPSIRSPSLDDEAYGAPEANGDHPIRFEPIFDIDPEEAGEPRRPASAAADTGSAPIVEPPRPDDEPAVFDETVATEPAPRARAAQVGDLEKEMARLLGEISGSRRP